MLDGQTPINVSNSGMEQNAPKPKMSAVRQRRQMKPRKPLDKYLLEFAEAILTECEQTEKLRYQPSFTLARRYRHGNQIDLYGIFNNVTGEWTDNIETDELYSQNIIQPNIRANSSAIVSAPVTVIAEATSRNPRARGGSQVADAVIELLDEEICTSKFKMFLANQGQLAGGCFAEVFFNPYSDDEMAIPIEGEIGVTTPGSYYCTSCGYEGEITELLQNGVMPCDKCGSDADVLEEPQEEKIKKLFGYERIACGREEVSLSSVYEWRIDPKNTQEGDIDRALWIEHHYLMTKHELEQCFPDFDIDKIERKEMSYPLKWQRELNKGVQNVFSSVYSGLSSTQTRRDEDQLYEVRKIWLRKESYADYVLPSDISFPASRYTEAIQLKAGTRLQDEFPHGICYYTCADAVIGLREGIVKDEVSYFLFLSDPNSAWGIPLTIMLNMQDDVTSLFTIIMQHLRKHSMANIVAYSQMFSRKDFSQDIIMTRAGEYIDRPIREYYDVIQPPQLGNMPFEMLNFQFGSVKEATLVMPALKGDPQANQPYAAQALQQQQAYGILTACMQSLADFKCRIMRQLLKIVHAHWSEEKFDYLKERFGDEWKEEYVEAFLECDVERDIKIKHIDGTEMPATVVEREQKLQMLITFVGQLQQMSPELANPLVLNELMSKLMELSGVGVDYNNTEADDTVAYERYEYLKERCKELTEAGYEVKDVHAGVTDPQMLDPYILEILMSPPMEVFPGQENHDIHKEYYGDQLRSLIAEEDAKRNNNLIEGLVGLCLMHDLATVAKAQWETQKQMMAQAPLLQMQQAQQQQQAAQAAEQQSAQSEQSAQVEAQKQQLQLAAQEEQSQMQAEQNAQSQAAQSEAQKTQHIADMAAREADAEEADKQREFEAVKQIAEMEHQQKLAQLSARQKAKTNAK